MHAANGCWTQLIAVFEMSAHPLHSSERENSSLLLLDQIIKTLALTAIDSNEPGISRFQADGVPVISLSPGDRDITLEDRCFCPPPPATSSSPISGSQDIGALTMSRWNPTWTTHVEWNVDWNAHDIEKEEIRRLCWCALSLAAIHTSQCAALHKTPLDLFIGRAENVSDSLFCLKGALTL